MVGYSVVNSAATKVEMTGLMTVVALVDMMVDLKDTL